MIDQSVCTLWSWLKFNHKFVFSGELKFYFAVADFFFKQKLNWCSDNYHSAVILQLCSVQSIRRTHSISENQSVRSKVVRPELRGRTGAAMGAFFFFFLILKFPLPKRFLWAQRLPSLWNGSGMFWKDLDSFQSWTSGTIWGKGFVTKYLATAVAQLHRSFVQMGEGSRRSAMTMTPHQPELNGSVSRWTSVLTKRQLKGHLDFKRAHNSSDKTVKIIKWIQDRAALNAIICNITPDVRGSKFWIEFLWSNLHQLQSSSFLTFWGSDFLFFFSVSYRLRISLINLELKVKPDQLSAVHVKETPGLTWIFVRRRPCTWLQSNSPSLSANLRGAHCLTWPLSQQRSGRGFGPWIKCHYLMRREQNGCSM